MSEATLSLINQFERLLAAEENSGDFLAHLNKRWPLLQIIGRDQISDSDVRQLIDEIRARVTHFQSGVLEVVRAFGGQFEAARLTTVPGGDLLESQRDDKIIKFWTGWHFETRKPEEKLTVEPSIASEVIYLPNLVEGSLGCTYDLVDGKTNVVGILALLPKVRGLRWIIGNVPTVNRVIANHLQVTEGKEYLLPRTYTWTTDTFESPEYGLRRLVAGRFLPFGVRVDGLRPFRSLGAVGVFALGVPA